MEDMLARGKWVNQSLLPLREGEPEGEGYLAKWAYPLRPYHHRWYHFGVHPKLEERFPFSSTLFVWFTDYEHLFQFVQTTSLILIIYVAGGWQALLAATVGLSVAQIIKEKLKMD